MLASYILISLLVNFIRCQSIDWQDGNWAMSCDFFGNDLKNLNSRGSECGGHCVNTNGCTHFTWFKNVCYLKSGPVTKSNAVFKANHVCGIVGKSGGGGSGIIDGGSTGVISGNNNGNDNFASCTFQFGTFYSKGKDFSAVDYIAIWAGSLSNEFGNNFNPHKHGEMLRTAKQLKKTPVYYAYIIAFMARKQWGLQDCNVGKPSLCQKGADYIRSKKGEIVQHYKKYAAETAKVIGRDTFMVWLIEPDFWQYYGDRQQEHGGVNGNDMRRLFDDLATAIKSELPKAKISWDITPWLSEAEMTKWWNYFRSSPHIDYLHTSGGESRADNKSIYPNRVSWRFVSQLTGKKIIADTGYGVAGTGTGHNHKYDNYENLKNRISDGVVSITQAYPKAGWKSTTDQLRKSLPKTC